jgi:hypothetical protein
MILLMETSVHGSNRSGKRLSLLYIQAISLHEYRIIILHGIDSLMNVIQGGAFPLDSLFVHYLVLF